MSDKKFYDAIGDEQFAHPYIDIDEWKKEPVRHRYIHGGFEGTESRFCFYWQADWYRHKIMEQSGTDGNGIMRLYMMEHCMHTDCMEGNGGDHQHIVSYLGALHQALLDVSDWVERGIEPPATTNYEMEGGQVILDKPASERCGIQPTVTLEATGAAAEKSVNGKITVKAGEKVCFLEKIEVTKDTGGLEEVTWDFTASDEFLPVVDRG